MLPNITMITSLWAWFWQAKKDTAQIFNNVLRRQIGTRSPTVEYLCSKSDLMFILVKGLVADLLPLPHFLILQF